MKSRTTRRWSLLVVLIALTSVLTLRSSQAALRPVGGNDRDLRTAKELGKHFGAISYAASWDDDLSLEQEVALQAAIGSTARRIEIGWHHYEPKRTSAGQDPLAANPGMRAQLDREVALARAAGMRPYFSILGAPYWASPQARCWLLSMQCHSAGRTFHVRTPRPDTVDEYARFVRSLAVRYPDAFIETWNEPNLGHFWQNGTDRHAQNWQPDPQLMASMQCAAYRAVQGTGVRIVGPGLSPTETSGFVGTRWVGNYEAKDHFMPMDVFLDTMYRAMAADFGRPCWDRLGLHAYYSSYGGAGSDFERVFNVVHGLQAKYGDTSTIWVTETGASDTWDDQPATPEKREHALHRQTTAVHRLLTMDSVDGVFVYALRDDNMGTTFFPDFGFGMLEKSSGPKPAPKTSFCHWYALNRNPEPYPGCNAGWADGSWSEQRNTGPLVPNATPLPTPGATASISF